MAYAKLRSKWKIVIWFAGIWLLFMFPIPFLPFWGVRIDENAFETTVIIGVIITIPFTFLAIFMNDGNKGGVTNNGTSKK
jgi:uncharacterized membrane protein